MVGGRIAVISLIDIHQFTCPVCGSSPKTITVIYDAIVKRTIPDQTLPLQEGTNAISYSVNCLNWHHYIVK